jgi:hypothetical protein
MKRPFEGMADADRHRERGQARGAGPAAGTRWWTERRDPKGWRCMRCCPPSHLPPEAIRRESEPDDAPRGLDRDADPLFRQAGIGALDHAGALRIESG